MALFLREDDVKQILTMPLALDRVAAAFRYLGLGEAADLRRWSGLRHGRGFACHYSSTRIRW